MSDPTANPLATTAPAATAAESTKTTLPGTSTAPAPAPLDLPEPTDAPHAQHSAPTSATESFFAKAQGFAKPYLAQAKPYLDQAAAQAKPYTDAALQKGKELKEKIEGVSSPTTATTAEGHGVDLTSPTAKTTGLHATGAHTTEGTAATGAGVQEKAKDVLGYGLASLQSAYNQVGAAIDAKTATPDKPGLFTQVSSAVSKGVAQIEKAVITPLNPNAASASTEAGAAEGAATTTATASAAAPAATSTPAAGTASSAPSAAATQAAQQHPIMTTTNAVPHNNEAGDESL